MRSGSRPSRARWRGRHPRGVILCAVNPRPPTPSSDSAAHRDRAGRIEPRLGPQADAGASASEAARGAEPAAAPGDNPGGRRRLAQRHRGAPLAAHAWAWRAGALGALLLAAALAWWRQPLSDWLWPDTRLQQLREQASLALADGRLSSADGHGARELYEAALALDPDRADTREGLARVGRAALAQARQAIDAGHFQQARERLALARELTQPRERVETLERALRQREAAHAGLDRLVAAAAAARAQGRLDGAPDAALPLYQRVLELQPQRNDALEGRDDTLADLLQAARRALDDGDLPRGAEGVARVQQADPGHADLPDALTVLERHLEQHRRRADQALRRQRLEQAAAGYREVLAVHADDAAAQRGLAAVAAAHAARGERLAADFHFAQAEAELARAAALDPGAPALAVARQHLERARQSRKRLDQDAPPQSRQALRRLLAEAAAAEQRGDLLTPPGDSAYDKLRAAQAIAPQDPQVRAAAARLLPAARRCFEQELRGNRLSRAGECLDARRALEGEGGALREASARLAQRWIAVGDERLGAGELPTARAALQAARTLDPHAPGIAELAARVQAAAAAN